MQHDPAETQACRQRPWAPPRRLQAGSWACLCRQPRFRGFPGSLRPGASGVTLQALPTPGDKRWSTGPEPQVAAEMLGGERSARRPGGLGPHPSTITCSCLTSSVAPLCAAVSLVTVAAHLACRRCREDPQTEWGQRAVPTLMGMSRELQG